MIFKKRLNRLNLAKISNNRLKNLMNNLTIMKLTTKDKIALKIETSKFKISIKNVNNNPFMD